jgi:hypothetical protein
MRVAITARVCLPAALNSSRIATIGLTSRKVLTEELQMHVDRPTWDWLSGVKSEWLKRTDPFKNYSQIFGHIPGVPSDTVRSAKLFAHRYEAISSLPNGGAIAEVGTRTGEFAKFMLDSLSPQSLHLFDLNFDMLKRSEPDLANERRVQLHLGDSSSCMSRLPDEFFNIIYIDGDHTENGVDRDTKAATRKLKKDGFLVFNDYTIWSPVEMMYYGIVPVVNRLLKSGEWSVLYFALHHTMYCDIALRRSEFIE